MAVDGQGKRGILIISEYPGKSEDEDGRPFVGGAGRWLASELSEVGIDMRRDCWLTNALACHPVGEYPATAVEDCRPNVLRAIRDLNPRVIILLGGLAIQSVIGHYWKPDVGPVTRWTGRMIPNHKPNTWIVPLNNPAYLLRDKSHPVETQQFRTALVEVSALPDRPWPKGPPDYKSRVQCEFSITEAVEWLRTIRAGNNISFDYETDRLRPYHQDSSIVCVSVCLEGRTTKAFMWNAAVAKEMRRVLADPGISKKGWNVAFESAWTKVKLGVDVAGWKWDGMLAAHALDPRKGRGDDDRGSQTTGLKFQSYVTLGAIDYSSHLEEMLKPRDGEGGYAENSVRQIEPRTLLTYCSLDSLLEWEVSQKQMTEMEGRGGEHQNTRDGERATGTGAGASCRR